METRAIGSRGPTHEAIGSISTCDTPHVGVHKCIFINNLVLPARKVLSVVLSETTMKLHVPPGPLPTDPPFFDCDEDEDHESALPEDDEEVDLTELLDHLESS